MFINCSFVFCRWIPSSDLTWAREKNQHEVTPAGFQQVQSLTATPRVSLRRRCSPVWWWTLPCGEEVLLRTATCRHGLDHRGISGNKMCRGPRENSNDLREVLIVSLVLGKVSHVPTWHVTCQLCDRYDHRSVIRRLGLMYTNDQLQGYWRVNYRLSMPNIAPCHGLISVVHVLISV